MIIYLVMGPKLTKPARFFTHESHDGKGRHVFSFWRAKGLFSGYVKFFSLFGFRCYQYIPQPFCFCTFQVNQKRILMGGCQNPEWELDANVINYFAESASAWSKRVLESLDLSEISIGALDDERLLRVISELLDQELDAADRVTAELSSEDVLLSTLAVEENACTRRTHASRKHTPLCARRAISKLSR